MVFIKKYYYILLSLLIFAIYLFTLAPSVIQIDSGELGAVQYLPGVAHPTGYPLFTMIGYLFLKIPLPFSYIYRSNLLAAIYTALAAGVFIYFLNILFMNYDAFKNKQKTVTRKKKNIKDAVVNEKPVSEYAVYAASIFGGLTLAFSKTFWFQSTSVEVYSLHLLLVSLILLFLLKAYVDNINNTKNWLWFAFFLGLGFTNHMTTLLIISTAAYLYFDKNRFNKNSLILIGKMLLPFFAIIILSYSYIYFSAMNDPKINWGDADTISKLIRHISGKQYQVWLFSSSESAAKQFNFYFSNLGSEFLTIIPALIGLVFLIKKSIKLFVFSILLIVITIMYSINYDIVDIDTYFLLSYYGFSIAAAFAFFYFVQFDKVKPFIYGLAVVNTAAQIFIIYEKVDQSGNYIFEDYTKGILNHATKNTLILSYQWDYFISASYYFQNVEGIRKDVKIVDKELLRRSWYYNQLEKNYPGLIKNVQPEVNYFNDALRPFEEDKPYNAPLLQSLFVSIQTKMIKNELDKGNDVYIGSEMINNEFRNGELVLPPGYTIVPDVYMFKVVKIGEEKNIDKKRAVLRIPKQNNNYTNFIINSISELERLRG